MLRFFNLMTHIRRAFRKECIIHPRTRCVGSFFCKKRRENCEKICRSKLQNSMQHLRADHNSTTNKEVDEQKAKVYRFHPNQRYLFLPPTWVIIIFHAADFGGRGPSTSWLEWRKHKSIKSAYDTTNSIIGYFPIAFCVETRRKSLQLLLLNSTKS